MKFKDHALSQAERRAILLLSIVALISIAVTAMRSCRSHSNDSMPPVATAEATTDTITATTALLPDTIIPADTIRHKRVKKRKPASSAYKKRNILDETL